MNCQEYTIAQWLQTWYDLYAKQNIRESPRLQYSYFINHLVIPQIGEIPLSQLTGLRLQIFIKTFVPMGGYGLRSGWVPV